MASFTADILLKVVDTEVDRAIKRIERKFAALEKSAELNLTVKGEQKLTGLSKRVDALGRSLERIKPTAIFGGVATGAAVAGAGVQKLVEALASLPKGGILEPLVGAIREFGANADAALGPATKFAAALTDFAASAPATAGGIALASGALFAFAPALKQAAGDAVALGKALFNLEKAGLIVKKLDESFELTRAGILAFAKEAGSLNVLTQELKDAKKELNDMDRIAEGFTEATQRQIDAEKAVNNELIRRKRIYTELNAGRQRILDNIEASRVSREASGFADRGPSAIDKSIRRQRERLAKLARAARPPASQAAAAPLMLPSSEMLNAAERGIKQIRSVTDQLGKDLDFINQRSRNFTDSLNAAAAKGQQLPGIFGQLGKVLEKSEQITTRNATVNKNVNQIIRSRLLLSALVNEGLEGQVRAESEALDQARRRLFIEQEIADVAAEAAKLREREAKRTSTANNRSKGKITENLFLGAGFPLLFGGGAGAVGGGVLGSLLGDGTNFGGQIFFSALGTALDGFAESTANLGAELNKAKPDVDAITERLGVVGTGTEAYINALKDSDQATKAAQAATDELAQLVGQDGVKALKDFGAQTTELGNELAKAFTLIAAAAAKIISQSSAFKELQTQLPRAVAFQQAKNSDNPEIQRLFSELEKTNAFLPGGSAKRAELGDKIIEKQLEINRLREEGNRIAAEGIAIVANEKELAVESAELVNLRKLALAAEGDQRLTLLAQVDEQVAKEALLAEKAELLNRAKLGEISYRAVALALQEKQVKLDERLRQIREGLAKDLAGGRSGGSGSGVDKEAQVQKTIAGLKTKEFELNTKILNIGLTKLEQIDTELDRLNALRSLKEVEIELSKEDDRIKQLKLTNLEKETSILRQQLELQKQRIQVDEAITKLKKQQETDKLSAALNTELENAQRLPTGNIFQDEQNDLLATQAERAASIYRDLNDQIAIQNAYLATGTKEQKASAAAIKPILEDRLAMYKDMLPQIAAAEQAQLKFNQTLSLVEGPVNAFVNGLTSGIQGIIDGTKSAEEAFADMLQGMAQALIQAGAKMIAQYIAIGVARMFAGLPTMSNGTPIDISQATGIIPIPTGYADGGRPRMGEVSVVGERGPELFVPDTPGRVISNEQSKAAMSMYSPGNDQMAPGAPMTTNITYSGPMLNFNGDEYIPRSEASSLVAAGAKQGEQRAMNRLRHSRSTRSKLGF